MNNFFFSIYDDSMPFSVRFVAVFPISLATAFLTCSIVLNPIQENISKAKLVGYQWCITNY